MNPQTSSKAKDFFLNLGATISLYTVVGSLINLLFTVINTAYPQITSYYYLGSSSISWPVAILVIFTPILIVLMWILGKQYSVEPPSTLHKWLTYLTLFIAGLIIAGDLITVLYYFIDGQELNTAFLLKVLVLLLVSAGIFGYYLSDIRGRLTSKSRKIWRTVSVVVVIGAIVLGFSVLGSPRTQRLYKYDDQKVSDLMSLTSAVQNYYSMKGILPKDFTELKAVSYYVNENDTQTQKPYEYRVLDKTSYEVCAQFNKASNDRAGESRGSLIAPTLYGGTSWTHPAGRHCFSQTVNTNMLYREGKPIL